MLIRITSRSSFLAKWQAYQVGHELQKLNPQIQIEYLFRESLGDKNLTDPLWKMPAKGVFTEDFYSDLIENKTDIVVHSWKDLPTEQKKKTFIAATLKRADQHDLLLFKKSSMNKKNINIYSSSPRRVHHVKETLRWALPFAVEEINFLDVRGNIQTRVNKLLQNELPDGLILAKAALDRLMDNSFYSDSDFSDLQKKLREQLKNFNFQILPLSENPTAAAQGALAIEILKSRTDLAEVVSKINSLEDFINCNYEREQLAKFGGGCHQKIGLSSLTVNGEQIFFASGIRENNEPVHHRGRINNPNNSRLNKKYSADEIMTSSELWSKVSRQSLDLKKSFLNKAVFITKKEALQSLRLTDCCNYASGIETWKHLAQLGIWIHGCTNSLGEDQLPALIGWIAEMLNLDDLNWHKLTHQDSPVSESLNSIVQIGTYKINYETKSELNLKNIKMLYWKSGFEFIQALKIWPELINKEHACGLGQSSKTICSQIPANKVTLYYDENDWRKCVLSTL